MFVPLSNYSSRHNFSDREALAPYVDKTLTWYGVVYRNQLSRNYRHPTNRDVLIVSLYNPRHDIALDHVILNIGPSKISKVSIFDPVKFKAKVYKYYQTAYYDSKIPFRKETYGLVTKNNLQYTKELPYNQLSKWQKHKINQYHFDSDTYQNMSNNGLRELKLSSAIQLLKIKADK